MKKSLLFLIFLSVLAESHAQPVIKNKKYPSLLWEITGRGLKTPSFLIGTMHVSNKMAFHLPDSFYYALRNAQVVALETNPETWQEDMNHYDLGDDDKDFNNIYGSYGATPDEYLAINTLRFYKYDTKLQRAMFSSPSAINSLLYRTYGNDASDFEEDTYLDMYIFQCGKKWGKKVCGVENYGESMRLMAEAYQDAARDKNKKERSYNDWDEAYSADKLQEAYRLGNLDLLDSINRYNSTSDAFDEKFLYRRNQIQASSIDSILRSGSSLFVGVGAAHLPGNRGVIELLRRMGYKLRPVKMGERASREKELVDKIRVPVQFHNVVSEDGIYKVDVPGKLFKSGDDDALDQKQYADMSNGSYYMVTRVMTNAWMWNHNMTDVYNTVDSLLYENIPGKIISKVIINRNGYKGFDIINRTRRGDLQRYNIFVTPFEVLFFKMSGNGDYVKNGPEADKFFGSIQLKEFKPAGEAWKKFIPPYGGFAVDLPHEPYVGNDGSWIFDAEERSGNSQYRVIRTDVHNYHFIEEDSFDLGLMNESFLSSEFIDSQLYRRQTTYKGYPALDAGFRDKQGDIYLARFIIQGPHYYTLVAHGKTETRQMQQFLNSFEIRPYIYGAIQQRVDTSLYFQVQTPYYPSEKKIKLKVPKYSYAVSDESSDGIGEKEKLQNGVYRYRVISNDSTGEKVFVTFLRSNRYHSIKDSLGFENEINANLEDTTCIYRVRKKYRLPGGIRVWETVVSDTNSSRALWTKILFSRGNAFTISTETDTLSAPSSFIQQFFESFGPSGDLEETDPFRKKSYLFFADLSSSDSVVHKRAMKHISDVTFDSTDLEPLKKAIQAISWEEKKYLETKTALVGKLGSIRSDKAADYLEHLYYSSGDTVQLQYAALENLLQQHTLYAFRIFGRVMANEPPVLGYNKSDYTSYFEDGLISRYLRSGGHDNGNFMDELYDTLQLTRSILPELLPLLNLRDYESTMMKLLSTMVDSGMVTSVDYESYFGKFYIEAKQELKKQAIAEKKRSIEKAEKDKSPDNKSYFGSDDNEDEGNSDLNLYASLLLPFADRNPNVRLLISQMLNSQDKRLRYSTMLLLLDRDKQVPDSLITSFGKQEEFRYELYSDLKERGMLEKFPPAYNEHIALGRSALMDRKSFDKPDTLEYVDRRKITYEGKTGYFYFFRYKTKKDDLTWKLAIAGMTPEDPRVFEFDDQATYSYFNDYSGSSLYNFTAFTNTKLDEDAPIGPQLDKLSKKLLYSRRKSAKEFYPDDENGGAHDFSD